MSAHFPATDFMPSVAEILANIAEASARFDAKVDHYIALNNLETDRMIALNRQETDRMIAISASEYAATAADFAVERGAA